MKRETTTTTKWNCQKGKRRPPPSRGTFCFHSLVDCWILDDDIKKEKGFIVFACVFMSTSCALLPVRVFSLVDDSCHNRPPSENEEKHNRVGDAYVIVGCPSPASLTINNKRLKGPHDNASHPSFLVYIEHSHMRRPSNKWANDKQLFVDSAGTHTPVWMTRLCGHYWRTVCCCCCFKKCIKK